MGLVRTVQTSSNSPLLCKFPSIGLLGQKRGDIFNFTIFVQKSVHIKGLLEISVSFFQKREIVQNRARNCPFTLIGLCKNKAPNCKFS